MRVLVAYETAHGSTVEIAEAIAEVLRERGAEVDVARCREVQDVAGYDAFVVGAAVWASNWLRSAQAFVRRFAETLAQRPTAYFHVSGAGGDDPEKIAAIMEPRLRGYAPQVAPVAIGTFGGVVDYAKYNLPIRLIMKAVVGREGGPTSGRHDLRDWDAVRAWAGEVYELFGV